MCRESSSVHVVEALRGPLQHLAPVAAQLFVLAAWKPQDFPQFQWFSCVLGESSTLFEAQERERLPAAASYQETVKAVFSGDEAPLLRAARQGFRLSCRSLRQLLQLATKLHSRRREGNAALAPELALRLAQVAKAILERGPRRAARPLRWAGEVFDVLQKMHEEQNKLAVRPMALCAFFQAPRA